MTGGADINKGKSKKWKKLLQFPHISYCIDLRERIDRRYSYVVENQPIGSLLFREFCETSRIYLKYNKFLDDVDDYELQSSADKELKAQEIFEKYFTPPPVVAIAAADVSQDHVTSSGGPSSSSQPSVSKKSSNSNHDSSLVALNQIDVSKPTQPEPLSSAPSSLSSSVAKRQHEIPQYSCCHHHMPHSHNIHRNHASSSPSSRNINNHHLLHHHFCHDTCSTTGAVQNNNSSSCSVSGGKSTKGRMKERLDQNEATSSQPHQKNRKKKEEMNGCTGDSSISSSSCGDNCGHQTLNGYDENDLYIDVVTQAQIEKCKSMKSSKSKDLFSECSR